MAAFDEDDEWEKVGPEHRLSGAPLLPAPVLLDPTPLSLPTHDLPWETVEYLVVALARDVDGADDPRLYGRRGQKQHGIDVVGFFTDRSPSVYQSRRWERFTASNLEEAVRAYAEGKRPFDAARLVVVTTADASDTAIIDKLAELRSRHADLTIDLWDRHALSRMLRTHPRLVARFFGKAAAERFCDHVETARTATPIAGVSSDAILRGPIAHLGLAARLAEADSARVAEPARAAEAYEDVAEALERSPFTPHASLIRHKQAEALRAAGENEKALGIDLRIMAAAIAAGHPGDALVVADRLGEEVPDKACAEVRACRALLSLAAYEHHHEAPLEGAAAIFDDTKPGDPYRLEIATLLAEHAVAAGKPELVAQRSASLTTIADRASADDASQLLAARLRACFADASGDWSALARTARTEYPPLIAALLFARHGRHLATRQDPQAAMDRYYEAIERACQAGAHVDAVDWLYAVRIIRVRFEPLTIGADDLDDLHRLALALRSGSNSSVIPAPFSLRERVLSEMHDGNDADALQALRLYRWRSVARGAWANEIEANQLLGQLYAKTGHFDHAANHLIVAGAANELTQVGKQLPERTQRLVVPEDFAARPAWERASAFTFVAVAADLLPDEDARSWLAAALTEILTGRPSPGLTPQPGLEAFKAFGELAAVSSLEQATQFLAFVERFVERAQNRSRHTDEPHAHALAHIARAHPSLRPAAVDQMCRTLIADERMARIVFRAGESLRMEKKIVQERCAKAAEEGNARAATALLIADADRAPTLSLARQRLDSIRQPRSRTPGQFSYGAGWGVDVLLATVLDEAARDEFALRFESIARDREEAALNRQDALEALASLAQYLTENRRAQLLPLAMDCARGAMDGSGDDDHFRTDALGRLRISMGPATLRYSGLTAAAALAHTPDQYAEVVSVARELIPHADEMASNSIAAALSRIPTEAVGLEVGELAAHSSSWMRALAAVMWCRTGGQPLEIGARLAIDPSPHVRKTLALHLPEGPLDLPRFGEHLS